MYYKLFDRPVSNGLPRPCSLRLPSLCEVDSYADDTTITATDKSVEEISKKLTDDCSKVSDWMRANRLKLNPDKTHILTVGTSR